MRSRDTSNKKLRLCRLDKAGLHGYNIRKGTLLQQSDPYRIKIYLMTVWGLAKRSSRFYTENVQNNRNPGAAAPGSVCCPIKFLVLAAIQERYDLRSGAAVCRGEGR